MKRDVFGAIADPTRREILHLIANEPLPIFLVAQHFAVSRTAIDKHIKILSECGLIILKQWGREQYCQARLEKLIEVVRWVEQYRKIWEDKFDNLEEYLRELQTKSEFQTKSHTTMTTQHEMMNQTAKRDLIITRVFDAPIEMVWNAWTNPEHLMRWWGPKGFTSPVCKIDFRTGGKYLFCMRSPEGQDYYSTGIYRQIVPMERIEYTDSFADAEGNVVPATYYGMSADFPEEMRVTITFKALGEKTEMTLTQTGLPDDELYEMTKAGWNQSFDKLSESLR